MQEEELLLLPSAAPSHPVAQPWGGGNCGDELGWAGEDKSPLSQQQGVCSGASCGLEGKVGMAVRGCCKLLPKPCSLGQVCCRGASAGRVTFSLLDLLEPHPGDTNRNLKLSPRWKQCHSQQCQEVLRHFEMIKVSSALCPDTSLCCPAAKR